MGIIYLAWMRWVYNKNISKLAQFSRRVFNINNSSDDVVNVSKGIDLFSKFLKSIHMPTSLQEIGISDKAHFHTIAQQSVRYMESGTVGNYVRLSPDDIVQLLNIAY